jgi:pimeloyl-ACP methyl ester carboxylesterase
MTDRSVNERNAMPFVTTTAGRVFCEERGSGVPVVLLHATLHDHRDFDPVAGPLATRYRTIAVDWPGHGRSDPPGRGGAVDAFRFAAVLADVVEGLDLAPAVLIGNSVGGFAAARLALDQPDRVAGLILVNTAGFTAQTTASRLGSRVLGHPWVCRRLLPRLVPRYMKARNQHDRVIAERVRARARTEDGARVAAGLWRSFGTRAFDLRADGPRLAAPTLLVWGVQDIILPLRAGRQTHAAIPGSQFRVFETGHFVFASDPDGFLDLAAPFIESATAAWRCARPAENERSQCHQPAPPGPRACPG